MLRPVLEFEAQRAREFYCSADELLPLMDEDSQPALWTLVEIYRRLLERIAARDYDVFSERVRLSTAEKLGVLARDFAPPDMSASEAKPRRPSSRSLAAAWRAFPPEAR